MLSDKDFFGGERIIFLVFLVNYISRLLKNDTITVKMYKFYLKFHGFIEISKNISLLNEGNRCIMKEIDNFLSCKRLLFEQTKKGEPYAFG